MRPCPANMHCPRSIPVSPPQPPGARPAAQPASRAAARRRAGCRRRPAAHHHGATCRHPRRPARGRRRPCAALVRPQLPPALALHPALLACLGAAALALLVKRVLDTPSRTYDAANPNVGQEYDAWTREGILEAYWGEHIHLGLYTEAERAAGYKRKDFKAAKLDFTDAMLRWALGVGAGTPAGALPGALAAPPRRILDVGCGIGGTSRHLAAIFRDAQVQGITLSPQQVERAQQLAAQRGLANASFQVMDALRMGFPDDTFDLVWACESGEHMPDKARYVQEMTRVLKPGGTLVIATWCQREETPQAPFSQRDRAALQYLYDEWAHPFFISVQAYGRLLQETGQMEGVEIDDWTADTLPSWRHSVWVGVWNPWPVISKWNPRVWYMVVREIVMLERMHRAFSRGLMQYGMAKAVKRAPAGLKGGSGRQAGGQQELART